MFAPTLISLSFILLIKWDPPPPSNGSCPCPCANKIQTHRYIPPGRPSHRRSSPDNTARRTAALSLNAAAHDPRVVRLTTFSPLPPPPCLVRHTAASPPTTPPDAPQRPPECRCPRARGSSHGRPPPNNTIRCTVTSPQNATAPSSCCLSCCASPYPLPPPPTLKLIVRSLPSDTSAPAPTP